MTDFSGFADAAATNDIVRQMVEGTPPQAPPIPPAAPGQNQQWPQGPAAWPTGPSSTQIPDPTIPPPAGMPPGPLPVQPLVAPPPAAQPPPLAPDPYQPPAGGPLPPTGPQLVQLPDGSTIDVETLRQIASVGGDRLQQLSVLDHAFRSRPDVQRAVEDAVNRAGMFPSVAQPPPAPAGYPPQYQPPTPPAFQPPALPPAPGAPTGYPPLPTRAPTLPQLPAGVDMEDPTVQFVLAQRAEIQQQLDAQRAMQAQQTQSQLSSGVARARHDVGQKYPNLSFDDWGKAEAYASQMGFAVGRFQTSGDYYEAARFALETAVETMPDPAIRARLSSRPMNDAQINQRQAQLAAVAGTGATAPRQDAPQVMTMTPDQRIQGMARELEAYAQGQPA
jgi:hypothetical protein